MADTQARHLGWRMAAGAILVLGLLGTIAVGHAAPPRGQTIAFTQYGSDEGLSQSTALSLFQDRTGFIWIGTGDGLNRFDGREFTVFKNDRDDPQSLPNDVVWAIEEDADRNLWVGTDGGGVAKLIRASGRFVRIPALDAAIANARVRDLHIDRRGDLWIATRGSGLFRFDLVGGALGRYGADEEDTLIGSNDVFAIAEDVEGRIWIATEAGVDRLDRRGDAVVNGLRSSPAASLGPVRGLGVTRDGVVWAGTYEGGLARIDPIDGAVERFRHDPADPRAVPSDRVRAILEDADGRLWIGTDEGLGLFEPESATFRAFTHDPATPTSLSDNSVIALLQDQGGVIWVGTRMRGVNTWNPLSWQFGHRTTNQQSADGLGARDVTSFAETADGDLWIGTFGGGVNVLGADGAIRRISADSAGRRGPPSDRVTALLRDGEDRMWIGTHDRGLGRYDPRTDSFRVWRHDDGDPSSLTSDGVMRLYEDDAGRLWVGTFRGGLARYDEERDGFVSYRHDENRPDSLSGDRVTAVVETGDGSLWVGTDGRGLNRMDREAGTFDRVSYGSDGGSDGSTVLSLLATRDALWVGTRGGGLDRLTFGPGPARTLQVVNLSERDGLPDDTIYSIEHDGAGGLWLGTNRGLARLDTRTGRVRSFDTGHGLQDNEFHFGSSYRRQDGRLLFGGVNGFNEFDPRSIRRNVHPPTIALTNLLLYNRPYSERSPGSVEAVELGYRDDLITLEFAALDFSAPERNRLAYRLRGFSEDWIEREGMRRITFTNLDGGRYVLEVRAANNDGVWSESIYTLPIAVGHPPWKTLWAYLGYGIGVLGTVGASVNLHRRKLRREADLARRLEREVRLRTAELTERSRELEDANRRLSAASLTDPLTGLANRRYLLRYLDKEVNLLQRRYRNQRDRQDRANDLAFIMVDLDAFKQVNDTYGHIAGDSVLRQMKELLEGACRTSDLLVRWGGDEFLIVGRDADPDALADVAERIRSRVAEHVFEVDDGRVFTSSCSIGFASYPFVPEQPDALGWEQAVSIADRALYIAKHSGRDAWVGLSSAGECIEPANLLAAIQKRTESLVRSGSLRCRTSLSAGREVVWE